MSGPTPDPDPQTLADDTDTLDWDTGRHGRMADHATGPDREPVTEAWEG